MEDDDRRKDGEERLDGRLEIQLLVEEGDVGGKKIVKFRCMYGREINIDRPSLSDFSSVSVSCSAVQERKCVCRSVDFSLDPC